MILPATQAASLVLLVISLICWGSWANTLKLAGKWRFELYYYDFAIGFALLAAAAAFTAGSMNASELTFQENFLITGYRNIAYVAAAGIVFNLGNMLLAATITVAGMAMAFTLTFAVALVVSTAWTLIFVVPNGMLVSLAGAGLLLVAMVVGAFAYSNHLDEGIEAAKKAALQMDPRSKQAKHALRPPGAARAIALSVVGGIALGLFSPLLDAGRGGDDGVSPYGSALLLALGIFSSTLVLGPFFFAFPVAGASIGLRDYFKGSLRQHLLGLVGGMAVAAAFLSAMVVVAAPLSARLDAISSYALSQGGPVLAVAWGLFVWREFKKADERNRLLFIFMWVLLTVGVGLLAVARR